MTRPGRPALTHVFPRPVWYLMAAVYVSLFAAVASAILYTNYVADQNERKWCHLLTTLDNSYRSTPPRTDSGRRVAADIHGLRTDLHCVR